MALITKPDMEFIWASGGAIVEPSDVKKQTGWTPEVPPHQWENWVQNRQDQYLAHINQRGIPAWDGLTNYEAGGLSYVQGSDGKVYKSVAASGPASVVSDPTTDGTDTYWTIAFADVGAFLTQATGDARYAQRSNNLSDLTNVATARTNLGAAPVVSPAFTGTPSAPTAPVGTNTTQLATTAFVTSAATLNAPISTMAAAGTINLTTGAPNTSQLSISGTGVSINGFTVEANLFFVVKMTGASNTLVNSAALVTGRGANIPAVAGDTFLMRSTAANTVEILSFIQANPPLKKTYLSSEQVITLGGQIVLAHGLGEPPLLLSAFAVCKTAENGYNVGDVVATTLFGETLGTLQGTGLSVCVDSTNITVRVGNTAFQAFLNKTTGAQSGATPANWRLIFRAYV